jgi:hypothetical protein
LNDRYLRPLSGGGHAMIAPRLLGLPGDGAAAALAQPECCARRARGYAANAQQLQHGVAAGHARRSRRRTCIELYDSITDHLGSPR